MRKIKKDAIKLKQIIGSLYKPKAELRDVAGRICSRIGKVETYWERVNKEPREDRKKRSPVMDDRVKEMEDRLGEVERVNSIFIQKIQELEEERDNLKEELRKANHGRIRDREWNLNTDGEEVVNLEKIQKTETSKDIGTQTGEDDALEEEKRSK